MPLRNTLQRLAALAADPKRALFERSVSPEIAAMVARIPKPVGSYGYDAWGYNEQAFAVGLAGAKWLYDHYFQVRAHGLENIPATGPVLVVPNHSGQLPMDGVLIGVAMATNPHGPRAARAMIERFFPTVPWLGNLLNAWGGVIGDPANCSKMLDTGEAIIVFPEGVRGSGKLYKDRYRLQRFGTGFLHLAIDHGVPVIPCGVAGCEEMMPALYDVKPLARLLGIPYAPVALPVPLPSQVVLHFGKPMRFGPVHSEAEAMERVDEVKAVIAGLIDQGRCERDSMF